MAVGAEVPLQVADPEDNLGDGGGSGVDFQPQELVRVDGVALHFEQVLAGAEVGERAQHFAFEALHVFERDVEEVAGAAGGVEDADCAQLVVEGADFCDGLVFLALVFQRGGGGLDGFPFVS